MDPSEVEGNTLLAKSSVGNNNGDILYKETKHSQLSLSRISQQRNVFVLTTVLLFIVCIALLVCFVLKDGQSNSPTPMCYSVSCMEKASEVMSFMNFSADPCEDFYNYACGGWEKENDIPDTESSWGQFSILSLKNDNMLKKLINDPQVKKKYENNGAMRKMFAFYEACMNTTHINALGAKPLQDLIARYHSWNVTGNGSWDNSSWDFMTSMVDLQRNLSVAPFFYLYVGADYLNSSLNVIKLTQSGLGMSRDTYLENRTEYEKIRNAYKKMMIQTVGLLGAEGDDVKRQMDDIFNLEKELAKITMPTSERRKIEKHYKKIKVKELANYTGNVIDWKDFLQRCFKEHSYHINDDSIVVVYALDYLRNMSQIYKNTPKTTVANYMMWRVVRSFMGSLSDDFKKIIQDYDKAKSGKTEQEPKWRQCLSSTQSPFGMPLGLLFVGEKFTSKSKTMVEELIREIRQIFIENLDQVDWMDKKTKKVAEDKALAILENIGYPDYLKNKTALEKKFEGLTPTNSYFDNILRKCAFLVRKNYRKIKKPVDNKEWGMDPQIVNAYYSFTENKIVFPAGILQAPFYNKDRPRSLNYGSIGAVVGHEITHGFDDNGRRFNKDGDLVKWWSNHSIEAFKNKTKCLVDQYSQYKYFGENIKGGQTVGENIADNGGVKQAYQAYKSYVKQHGQERLLPGLNATNDQLFFLGFGQVWCGKFRKQTALAQIANGVHTPGKYRVIGTLSNSDAFAKAYKCAPGTKMNPKKKCQVW